MKQQSKDNYDSNLSRKEFLKIIGITGVGIGMFGLSSCFDKKNTLRFYGTGTLDIGDKWKQLETDLDQYYKEVDAITDSINDFSDPFYIDELENNSNLLDSIKSF